MSRHTRLAHQWVRYSIRASEFEPDDGNDAPDPVTYAIRLPVEYFGVNRILLRWAVSVAGGIQTDVWDDVKETRPPPLDEPHAYLMDRIICKLKKRDRRLITYWYRKNIGIRQIKKKLHIRNSVLLYQELADVLREIVARVRASDSSTLISLLEWRA